MSDELAVWLDGMRVATVVRLGRRRLQLRYSAEALGAYPAATPLLSLSLPLRPDPYGDRAVRPFLDGLLPEGPARLTIAYDLGLPADDPFNLLGALGRDCAGALVVQPPGARRPPAASTLGGTPLSDAEIEALVANLRVAPLGVDEQVRVSLGGVQEKLLLTELPDGTWARPMDGIPSTHILKPELARFPGTLENEAFCLATARHLGLAVADAALTVIGARPLLVVRRYDRVVHPDGTVERIHQEDLCQALGVGPEAKYEADGGPSLRAIARLLAAHPVALTDDLLRAVTLNVVLGNGDAHAKNFSLLHRGGGTIELAPLYDLLCTLHYGDTALAMGIAGVGDPRAVTAAHLVAEARRWAVPRRRATEIVADLLDRLPAALSAAAEETPGVPEQIVSITADQLGRLRGSLVAA